MPYTYPVNITGFHGLALWANSVTDGLFWTLTLLLIWVVLFFSYKSYTSERAFAGASVISMFLSFPMYAMGLINAGALILVIILASLSIVALRAVNSRTY